MPQQTVQLAAVTRDAGGAVLTGRAVAWSPGTPAVASVSAAGVVTALSSGASTITATSEGRTGTANITVADGGFVVPAGTAFTAGGGRVAVDAPAGAVGAGSAITVAALASPPADPDLIPGNAWTLGPASTTFAQPITVRLTWIANSLPAGTIAEQVRVHRWDGAAWAPLANGSVDVGTRTASGTTTALGPFALLGPKAPTQSTFMVTTTADAGAGSLRQAILDANATPGADLIHFNIAGAGPHTISPLSPLPVISDPATIDGLTQPGASCAAWPATLQIEIEGSMTAFAPGPTLTGGSSTIRGLVINRFFSYALGSSGAGHNVIECNYIGTDVTGTQARAGHGGGISLSSDSNQIGGLLPNQRNLVAGHDEFSSAVGIRLDGSANVVQGNVIGTSANGLSPLGNSIGIGINGHNNLVGGTEQDVGVCNRSCNLVSGNAVSGISIGGNHNIVQGNFIGTDPAGGLNLGNGAGVIIAGILANPLGNQVGGSHAGAGNRIAFNGTQGVRIIAHSAATQAWNNAVLGNLIFSNGALGLDLCPAQTCGVTANDPGDADTGPNTLQNFPVLTAATLTGTLAVTGTLNSTAATTFRIEFFANDALDPSGHGEGQRYLGFVSVTTDGSGNAAIAAALPATGVAIGNFITATATDAAGNTSEFSMGRVVQ